MLLKVYPNPFNHEFIFIDYSSRSLTTSFKVTDIMGLLVSEGTIKEGTNCVKVGNLTPGIYILNLFDEQNILTKSIKIVKTYE
ncbi:MAG: T9SS type A sorting domain-containing protein [Bacteroidia bacterium]|nr:T9SS type A sorting domain-containing protein [Bacteroidia bacterium]